MNVETPAKAIAPCGPTLTIRSRSSGLASESSEECNGELSIATSIERCRAERIGFVSADGGATVSPGGSDIRHDGGDLIVG